MSGFLPDYFGADVRVSPNFTARRGTDRPDMIILHYTGMPTAEEAEAWLCDPASEVSSHYLVHEDGRIVQMVRESDRAWHAGKSSWRGNIDVNSWSIGIEIVNPGHGLGYPAFPQGQIDAVIALCRDIIGRHGIVPDHILAHSDVAPGRKVDPGEKFPWRQLAQAGVGHYVEPARTRRGKILQRGDEGAEVEKLQSMLSLYGYGVEMTGFFCERTETVVAAFQLHFRPRKVDGVADPATVETLSRLLSNLPRRQG
jgi:N-acetylmuramoyl-L-alanine amidase